MFAAKQKKIANDCDLFALQNGMMETAGKCGVATAEIIQKLSPGSF